MRKIKLYIAMSLDGKIADKDGGVEWLDKIPNPEKSDFGYSEFYNSIDITIMGNSTYQQVLSFDVPFPYPEKENFVFTQNTTLNDDKNVIYVHSDHLNKIHELRNQNGKDIWLVGGAKLNSFFINHDLIDEMMIHVMPTILGDGIPLFYETNAIHQFKLQNSETYSNGVTFLHYSR